MKSRTAGGSFQACPAELHSGFGPA